MSRPVHVLCVLMYSCIVTQAVALEFCYLQVMHLGPLNSLHVPFFLDMLQMHSPWHG